MKPYIAIVHKDADSAYGLTFPDAPGCFSAAEDAADIFAMAREALELWAEGMREAGRSLNEPRDIEALRADPEWAPSFAGADFIIAIEPPWHGERLAAE